VNDKTRDIVIIVSLLIATLVFGLVLIPIGISERSGNIGAGLSPRFMPELASAGIAFALLFGLFQYLTSSIPDDDMGLASHHVGGQPLRAVVAITICLIFALVGFNATGFYLGGVIMGASLTLLLGERKLLNIIVVPILVLTVIYLVFEFGFQIRLPKSGLIPGVPV
jgi:hypothetical protein